MIMFIYVIQNYILLYIICIMYIMSIKKSCLRLLRMGCAGAERMRRRATAGTRPQPGGYVCTFQDSDPAPGHRRVLAQPQAMNVGPVGGSIPWRIPGVCQCAPARAV